MAIRSGNLYDVLVDLGADRTRAREASDEVANYENRISKVESKIDLLTWMVGFNLAMSVSILFKISIRPMPSHHESRRLAYTPEQLFDLVADVGRYPEFLPWVIAARVTQRDAATMTADMVVGFQFVRERFTSRVTFERPGAIHVDYVDGPLKFLTNEWRFRAAEGGGTVVDLMVAFEFKSRIFERLAGAFFGDAFRTMVGAFERRAARLYGVQPSPSPTGINSSKAQITA